jgi:hypothetical protein
MPGDHVRWFAQKQGWPIKRYNVVTEGESDVRYITVADRLFRAKRGRPLLTDELSVFAVGKGLNGGARRISAVFPTLRDLIDVDLGSEGQLLFKAITLLDDDPVGREAYASLTDRCVKVRGGRDVFLLARNFPRIQKRGEGYNQDILAANKRSRDIYCEMEDLLPQALVTSFLTSNGMDPAKQISVVDDAFHVELDNAAKGKLVQFCDRNASYDDLARIVDMVQSLRYYLGLTLVE